MHSFAAAACHRSSSSTRSGTPAASSHGSTRRYAELRLAIEVDGFEHHSSPDAFQRDRTRQNRLVALGWTVLRFTWEDVVKRPAMVAQTIRDADPASRRRLTAVLCAAGTACRC